MLLVLEREFRRRSGFTVLTASKQAEALALLAEQPVELVISDVRLGKDSGFDLVREMKRSWPDLATILITAYRSTVNRQMAESLGVLLFLEKPFPIPRLIEEVESFFQRRENPEPPVTAPPPEEPAPERESSALTHFKLQDLVQLFCLNGRNILITVASESTRATGEIYIQRGRVIHADFEGKTGDEGFHALMGMPEPVLRVKDWTAPVPVTIQTNWEHLLLQSAIHFDLHPNQQASGLG